MRVDAFDYTLPEDLIALRPVEPREAARLLVIDGPARREARVGDLPELLAPGDVLVLNDTKVIPARLRAHRPARRAGEAGVVVELLLHRPLADGTYNAFARPAKRLRAGDTLTCGAALAATVMGPSEDGLVTLAFDRRGQALDAALAAVGEMPLPPYIADRRAVDGADARDYQTVYAASPGAVAAPTAGLHLTPGLLAALERRGIRRITLTLHVGAGTFLPVRVADTDAHVMHAEWGRLTAPAAEALNAARADGCRIVALGTTSLRLLESAVDADGYFRPFEGDTQLFITPGYRFRAVDRLFTNFHLPRSTLLMLVQAFGGVEPMRAAYAEAIARRFRFYSYGDACLIDRARDG